MRIIQRFGRIDRIGSRNKVIQLVNFWPDVTLDEYINLKAKVETRMKIVDMTASYHPEYKDMYYPINYGYIEGVMAPDGEEQDAYILGVNEPVKKFTGKIIAIVRRKDDIEEKWVVVPDGVTFSKEEIRRQIHFQEQYFDSEIVM